MKVKELIKQLKKLDPSKEVILSADSEGNYYGAIGSIEVINKKVVIYPWATVELYTQEQQDAIAKALNNAVEI